MTTLNSFHRYISRCRIGDPLAKDFIADTLTIADLPDFQTWSELRGFMHQRGAVEAAVQGARKVWLLYSRKLKGY